MFKNIKRIYTSDIKRAVTTSKILTGYINVEVIKTSELRELDNPIIIEGHTDNKPISTVKYPSNWELSTARATNIIKFLTENNLITPKRLSAVGYGEYMPIADNSTTTGRAKNRRVDIIVLSKN